MNDTQAPLRSSPTDWLARHQGLVAVLVAGFVLRWDELGRWWLNPDEGTYYSILTRESVSGFWQEIAGHAHPPLYYLFLRIVGSVSWDFQWLRLPSVLLGLTATAVVWALARRLSGGGARGEVAGLVAGLFMALSPSLVEMSQVMRPYTLQLTLLSAALLFLLRYLDEGGRRNLGVYLALAVLAVLTHYSSVLAVTAFGLIVAHDGLANGFARREWRVLALTHAFPAVALGLFYVVHLRDVMASELASEALTGWLAPYMIEGPESAWRAFLGFHRLLAEGWLRGATALLTLALLGSPVALMASSRASGRRKAGTAGRFRPALLAGSALTIAIPLAALGIYPLGPTRHSAWMLPLVVPGLGWVVAHAVGGTDFRLHRAAGIVLLVVLAGPIADVHAPVPAPEHVVTRAGIAEFLDLIDPDAAHEPIVMSMQTYYLLLPFYVAERERSISSPDGRFFHFRLGERPVIVSEAWNLSAVGTRDGDHLQVLLERAATAFPELGLDDAARVVFFTGGWRPSIIDEIRAAHARSPFIVSQRSVPGLWAFLLDAPALRAAYTP
ncbi:MAG: glycosyltransferase family 39 protein [Gemmatimonadota bacterium]